MFPLQGHHIHYTETAGVERKEEHFQKFFSARFSTGLVIFKQCRHLFLTETFAVKLCFFFRKRYLSYNAHILNPCIDGRFHHPHFTGVCTRF